MEAPLALYRRYRPDTFAEVIGQDHVTAPLRNALSNNRVNHAYLFSGPRGCGKTTSARILARAINCEKGPIAEPCGVCKSCTDLARGGPGSIDVIEIDAASHGGVDDARDLRERAFFAPVESRYKIYIIDEAHMVTTQGFNALLKLVEEPPPHLKFIFATTEPDKVIGTIRSRTHHYPFRLVPPKVLGDYMATLCEAEGVAIAPAVLPLVVRAGAGSVRDSLSVLDQLIGGAGPDGVTYELAVALLGFTPDSLLDACVDGFAAHDSRAVFETIEKVIETGQDPKRFAEDLLRRLRDLVVLSAVPNAVASGLIEVAEDQGERLQTQAAGIGAAELTRAADIVAAGLLEMRGATAPRLQLELICAKVLLPGADDSTNGIQARLDRLERRLTISSGTGGPAPAPPVPLASQPAQPAVSAQPAPVAQSAPSVGQAAAEVVSPARSHPGPQIPDTEQPGDRSAPAQSSGGTGRTGAWGDESTTPVAPTPQTPSSTSPEAPARAASPAGAVTPPAAAAAAPVSAGSMGLADVRRLWPEVLEAVKAKRRFAWIMLSQNAQVIAVDDQTLTLGLVNAGARESFARSGSDEILRQAMIDTIGLNRRVEAVVDPSTDPGTGHTSPPPPNTPPPSSWDRPTPSTSGPSTPAPTNAGPTGGPAPADPTTSGSAGGPDTRSHHAPGHFGSADTGPTPPTPGQTDQGQPGAGQSGAGQPSGGQPTGQSRTGQVGGGRPGTEESGTGHAGGGGQPGAGQVGVAQSVAGISGSGHPANAGLAPTDSQHTTGQSAGRGDLTGGSAAYAQHAAVAVQDAPDQTAGTSPAVQAHAGQQANGTTSATSAPSSAAAATQAPEPAMANRRGQAASKRRAAEAAVAAEQAKRVPAHHSQEPPLSPEEEAEAIGDDDLVLEDDSKSHTDLLRETLGAQIITEEPT
ncbi:DNA polymerase-3 subunit gamma/tau [Kribbella sp. VKM Ac-2527]|uniref:DNA-directed DNA polymerase n=1 Tax=Kribbella caucasensis TaxID=2512215 RepID=A0A4R6JI93_9ACTN|nr:DNA polymerase-3 subunit gamma/tau [Kribbella sp. VKM Ac-2527]